MEKNNIRVEEKKCSGCLICQLRCSHMNTGTFNPIKARINIEFGKIDFSDDCIEQCSLCARYCVYGALIRIRKN